MCNGSDIMSPELSTVLNTLVGAVLGFAAAVFAEPLRHWIYRPKLKLSFDEDPDCRARTPEQAQVQGGPRPVQSTHEADYIRVKVINTKPSIAKNCRAYLVGVRGEEAYGPLDLPRGIVQFVDIVSTRSVSADFKPEIKPIPYRYFDLFRQHGKFRFTVQVSGENVKPVFIKVVFGWSGIWDQYETSLG
jgi:hypothetical protein